MDQTLLQTLWACKETLEPIFEDFSEEGTRMETYRVFKFVNSKIEFGNGPAMPSADLMSDRKHARGYVRNRKRGSLQGVHTGKNARIGRTTTRATKGCLFLLEEVLESAYPEQSIYKNDRRIKICWS